MADPSNPFTYPVSQPYGYDGSSLEPNGFHQGIDYAAPAGTPVPAPQGGTVIPNTLGETGYGPNLVLVKMANGLIQLFGHLSSASVKPGDTVQAGQIIGTVGSAGNSTGPHLHYGVLTTTGSTVNPSPYVAGGKFTTPATGTVNAQPSASDIPVVGGLLGLLPNIFGDIVRIILGILAIIAFFLALYTLFRPSDAPSITEAAGMAAKVAVA